MIAAMSTTKILLIEDNEDVADSQRMVLQDLGYKVLVTSPASAELAFDQWRPDAVLLHLGHPNSTWLDLAERFALEDEAIPVIGLTAWDPAMFDEHPARRRLVALVPRPGRVPDLERVLPPVDGSR